MNAQHNKYFKFNTFLCTLLILFSFNFNVFAQVDQEDEQRNESNEENIESKIEKIAEETEGSVDDYTELVEQLIYLQKNPINLNRAKAEDLKQIPFLTEIQINNLLSHIKNNGKLASIYELQSIDGFTPDVIDKITPFVYVSEDAKALGINMKDVLRETKGELYVRTQQVLEEQQGFSPISDSALLAKPNSRYLGSPYRLYTRFRLKYYNNISIGITAEKDPGEEFFKGSQKNGFDYYSAHFFIKDIGIIKALAIGDYHAQFGQGLTFWTGLAYGKSADAVFIKKVPLGLKPYTSSDENLFLRGVATTIGLNKFEITGFYSKKKIDANVKNQDTLSNEDVFVSSFDETGLHTTPAELSKKDALGENIFGGRIAYKTDQLNIGATAAHYIYDIYIQKTPNIYNKFEFSGEENTNIGIDYSYIFRNVNFFGEVSRSQNGGMAYLNGILVSLDQSVNFAILHRNYGKDFQSFYSTGFSEGSSTYNEKGIYIGLETKFDKKWLLRGYVDNFWFPWLKSYTTAPSKGVEYLSELHYIPSKKVSMYGRVKIEVKQTDNTDASNMINYLQKLEKQNYRFHISYDVTPYLSLKNRFEYMQYVKGNKNPEKGYILYQDAIFKPRKLPFTLNIRYAIFNTDSYNTAIYAYETDVLYAYSVPSYYYKGSRGYVVLHYRISRNFDLWLRYSRTFYANKNVIGSDLTEIQANHKSEIKAQLRIRF